MRDIQLVVQAAREKPGDALGNTIEENVRQVAAMIRREASFGDLAKKVRVVTAIYDPDTGRVGWLKE
ncbi:MAG: hypothetical protein PHV34_05155 [Verrucomicrobiae bacterium]|nr:hypothetical protein [Verrucomicrobiae bacterium]